MPCEGSYIGGCCDSIPAGAVQINLLAAQIGFQPFRWPNLARQWARYASHSAQIIRVSNGASVTYDGTFQPSDEGNIPSSESKIITPGWSGNDIGSFVYYEAVVTETSFEASWWGRSSAAAPLKEFLAYTATGSLSGEMPLAQDRALATLAGLSFNGLAVGSAQNWNLSRGGVLTNTAGSSGSFTGYLNTNAQPYEATLPSYGAFNSLNDNKWAQLISLPGLATIDTTSFMAGRVEIVVACGKALWINAGWGRERRRHWPITDLSGTNKTLYYCAADILPFTPIELFPVVAGSGVDNYNRFESLVNFYPVSTPNACSLP